MNMFAMKHEKLILRDYQEKTVSQVREAFRKTKKVILCLSTGGGKTATAVHMIKSAVTSGKKCLFCADQINLIDQAVDEFTRFGVRVGVIQGDHPLCDPQADVQICSPQTLSRRGIPDFDFCIMDEIHHYHTVYDKILARGGWCLGMSATPYRKGLGNKFDELVTPITMRELIDAGHLVDFRVFSPSTINMDGVKTVAGDFEKKETADRCDRKKITGDVVKHWLRLGENRKTVAFCVNIGHANHMAKEFRKKGVKAEAINCYMRRAEGGDKVKDAIRRFKNGEIKILVSVSMLTKGFDQKDIECLIMARPTKSPALLVQMVGRGLRQYPNSRDCIIFDHAGNHQRLGFADEISIDRLDEKSDNKSERKKKDRSEKLPIPCPSCDYLKPTGVHKCAACGFEPENIQEIEAEEGELREVKRAKKARREYSLADKQNFLAGLNYYARSKSMKRHRKGFYGWAIYKYADKFGCKPSSGMDWNACKEPGEEVKKFIQHLNIKRAKSKVVAEKTVGKVVCQYCGGVGVGRSVANGPHKYQYKCASCDRHLRWGKV